MLTSEAVGNTRVIFSPAAASNVPVLGGGPLFTAGDRQHHHVNDLAEVRRVALRQHELDDQQLGAPLHRFAAVAENRQALILVPIVNDVRQDVGVPARRNAVEEAPVLDRDSAFHPVRAQQRRRVRDDMRAIEEDASRLGVAFEDVAQHVPGGAADIDDRAEAREVIGGGNRRRLRAMDADHGFAELRGLLRMLRQIVEERHAPDFLHRGLTGLE